MNCRLLISCFLLAFLPANFSFVVARRFCESNQRDFVFALAVKGVWQYHCQFFGQQAERSWVTGSSTMPFDGREAFDSYTDFLIQSAKGKSQKKALIIKFEVRPTGSSRLLLHWLVIVRI